MSTSETSYRRSAIQGASPIGLMIVLFDRLAADLRRAAAALRRNDIETRSKELTHAALVIGQLENWIDLKKGGESAQLLARFYAYLRAKMIEAAATKSAELLETQIDTILHVRSAWQRLDAPPPTEHPAENQIGQMALPSSSLSETELERIPFSLSG